METAGPIPSPSSAWSRMAVPATGECSDADRTSLTPAKRGEDAAQLKARLLRMIVNNEQSRKSAANEAFNGR